MTYNVFSGTLNSTHFTSRVSGDWLFLGGQVSEFRAVGCR